MKRIKIWPHVTIAILCAVLSGVAAALLVRHQQTAEAQVLPSAARIERVDGEVGLNRSIDNSGANEHWVEATANTPVSVGDRIYARDKSRAAIAFTGRNFARLNEHASLDVLSLSERRTQLALRDGSAIFNVGSLAPGELFEVATPYGAVDLNQPGLYQIGFDDRGYTVVSVLSGLAQVVGLGGTGQISKGEMLTLIGQAATDVALSRLDPAYAGTLVDDYYSYQYPRIYDGRYRDYNAYLSDPYYYDPYNRYVSYRYVTDIIPGVDDLDYYGDWRDVSGYGYCWHPRVDAGWAPYQQGYWVTDDPYGLTWVSNEAWGYAPYHYGRWVYIDNQWFWIPERVNTQPSYAPALVAFVPLAQENVIGWVPLGPGDPYAPRYYDANWQPHYLTRTQVVEERIVNLNVPGAVTVVPVQDFSRVINRNIIARVDPQKLAHVRPVLDPFAVDTLRQAALQTAKARRKIDVPLDIAQRLDSTKVVASSQPPPTPFRKDLAQALRVEAVPEKQRKEKLQFKDNRQPVVAQQNQPPPAGESRQPAAAGQVAEQSGKDQERDRKMAALAAEAERGNKAARRQMQQLERQQRREERAQQNGAPKPSVAQQQQGGAAQAEIERRPERAQGERVGQPLKKQKEAGRQPAVVAKPQQRNAVQQRIETRKQANQGEAMRRVQQTPPGKARAQQSQERPVRAQPPQTIERKQSPPKQQAAKSKDEQPAGKGKGHP